jgi:hypothetical protein
MCMVEKGMAEKGYGNIFKSSYRSLISKGHCFLKTMSMWMTNGQQLMNLVHELWFWRGLNGV